MQANLCKFISVHTMASKGSVIAFLICVAFFIHNANCQIYRNSKAGIRLNSVVVAPIDNTTQYDVLIGGASLNQIAVFYGTKTSPTFTTLITSSSSSFGSAVATGDLNNDTHVDLAVGSPSVGKVDLFYNTGSSYPSTPNLTVTDPIGSTDFGSVVALANINSDSNIELIVGAPLYSNNETNEGAIYIYGGNPPTNLIWSWESNFSDAKLGTNVALFDGNGDGHLDLAAGAPFYGATQEGAVFVFYGSDSGFGSIPDIIISISTANLSLGYSVANGKDLNGDGIDDLIIGAPYGNKVYITYGNTQGIRTEPDDTISIKGAVSLGKAVAGAGDVNWDGYKDVLMGSDGWAYLMLGSHKGVKTDVVWKKNGTSTYGHSLSSGDLDGDGFSDLVVGSDSAVYFYGKLNSTLTYPVAPLVEDKKLAAGIVGGFLGAGLLSVVVTVVFTKYPVKLPRVDQKVFRRLMSYSY